MRSAPERRLQLSCWAEDHLFAPGVAVPDDWPIHAKLSCQLIDPLWGGAHMPSSTGIYAAVNAIRLAMLGHGRLSQRDQRDLIEMGWAWRCKRGEAAHAKGLRVGHWVRMVEALIFAAAHRHGQHLTIIRPWREARPSKIDFLRTVERLLVSNHVVATLFAGAHFSIICGYTPESLLLFDSTGRTAIRRRAVSMTTGDRPTRHRVAASATLAIRRSI